MPEYTLDRSLAQETWRKLDAFTQGYVEAAMWTLTDEDGHSCDHLGLHDLADDALVRMVADCTAFQADNADDLAEYADNAAAGHDFWLTRNGHGAGYWDRGLGALGRRLSDAAKTFGTCDLYVGDDGYVHCH